jgi:hypothetical protein
MRSSSPAWAASSTPSEWRPDTDCCASRSTPASQNRACRGLRAWTPGSRTNS